MSPQQVAETEKLVENILVVVFDNAKGADGGFSVLNELDCDGIITLHAGAVIDKNANGTASVKDTQGSFPAHAIAGPALGSLIGLLGGMVGFGVGATIGGIAGVIRDLHASAANSRFVEDVSAVLEPHKFAVVADVSEGKTTPVDVRMKALGGILFRTDKQNFEYELRAQEITEIRARIDQLKGEEEKAMADQKSNIQAQIDTLSGKLQAAESEAEQRAQQIKREAEAKVQVLQKKAAKAQGEAKAKINAQIDELRKKADASVARLKSATSGNSKETGIKQQKAG